MQIGKDGRLFILDRDNLGGRNQGPGGSDAVLGNFGPYEGVWGHPAVYGGEGGYVYTIGSGGPLRAFSYGVTGSGLPSLTHTGASTGGFGYTSGSPVVTSTGSTPGSALVWAIRDIRRILSEHAEPDEAEQQEAIDAARLYDQGWSAT